jgi:hypothetical protein
MPASVSSLVRVVEGTRPVVDVDGQGLCEPVQVLSVLPDPRRRQGRRFDLAGVLGLAVAAAVAGARSYRAVAEWVCDLHARVLGWFGVGRGAPSLAKIRRVVLGVDADLLDAVLTAWVTARASRHRSGGDLMCVAADRLAVDRDDLPSAQDPDPGAHPRPQDRVQLLGVDPRARARRIPGLARTTHHTDGPA